VRNRDGTWVMPISGTRMHVTAMCLPHHPLEAYFPAVMAQDDVEVKLRSFCVLGIAPNCSTVSILTPHTYPSPL
jgi:hypothetical protein